MTISATSCLPEIRGRLPLKCANHNRGHYVCNVGTKRTNSNVGYWEAILSVGRQRRGSEISALQAAVETRQSGTWIPNNMTRMSQAYTATVG